MNKKVLTTIALAMMGYFTTGAQDAKAVLEAAAQALDAGKLTSIQFSGRGSQFELGQAAGPDVAWPRFKLTSFTTAIDYQVPFMRQELWRGQGEDPPRGGGPQPLIGEQRQVQFVSGKHAWNQPGQNPASAPAAADERLLQIWMTPHGFIRAAQANNATVKVQTAEGRKQTIVSFTLLGNYKVNGTLNDQNVVERVETWIGNPVLGDMLVETSYSDYRDFDGVRFPGRIVQKQGGFPTLDLTILTVGSNNVATVAVPQNVLRATPQPVQVDVQVIADGVWYLAGGTHHSVAVEFNDHLVVIEGPLNEERSLAVIAEIERLKLAPSKPIRYLVNTHQHFDHSGGIRAYAAEGATIVTHEIYRPFYEKVFSAPRTLNPDRLARSERKAVFEVVRDRRVLTDGLRTLELHHVRGSAHNDGMLMAYLPNEKLLIEADMFNPGPPGAPPPAVANPFSVNLFENIQRLELDVARIAPLHGRLVPMDDLITAIRRRGQAN